MSDVFVLACSVSFAALALVLVAAGLWGTLAAVNAMISGEEDKDIFDVFVGSCLLIFFGAVMFGIAAFVQGKAVA